MWGFIINWQFIFYPFKKDFIKEISILEIMILDNKLFMFHEELKGKKFIDNQLRLKFQDQNKIVFYTYDFTELENGKSYMFTCVKVKVKNEMRIFIFKINEKYFVQIFFINYVFLIISILVFILGLIFIKFMFRKIKITSKDEIKLYIELLNKYIEDEEFFKKINKSQVFITPRFGETINAINLKLKIEENKQNRKKIKMFLKKCISKK